MGCLKHPYNIRQLKEFKKKHCDIEGIGYYYIYLKFIRVIIRAWIYCYTVILKYRIRNKNT